MSFTLYLFFSSKNVFTPHWPHSLIRYPKELDYAALLSWLAGTEP